MADRIGSVNNIEINWIVPQDILLQGPGYYNRILVHRSSSENTGYIQVADIASDNGQGAFLTSYVDPAEPVVVKDCRYYLIQFSKTAAPATTSKYFPTFFSLTPRELRLTAQLRHYLSKFLGCQMTDEEIRQGFQLGLQVFNITPPVTYFTIDTFPKDYEPLLISVTLAYTLLYRYLGIAITDFSYGDQGLSLNIDRGPKVKQAVDDLLKQYDELISKAKLEFAYTGAGMGTLQLPISLGGNLNRGLLNVLDIFTALGR